MQVSCVQVLPMSPDRSLDPPPYTEYPPPPRLRPYVACFWRSSTRDLVRETTILPDGCIDLIWQSDREPFIAGPMTIPASTTAGQGETTLGIRFRPGAAATLLGVSAAELRDLTVDVSRLWSQEGRRKARDLALANAAGLSLHDAASLVDTLRRQTGPGDRLISDACAWFARHPGTTAADFIARSGLSERHARRRFQEHVGYGPKTLQRILRMQHVLWLMSRPAPPHSLASLAQAAGYADQAHLTREMRALTGQLPTTLLANNPQSAVADLFKTAGT